MSIIHTALRKVQNKRFKLWERKEIENPFKDLNFTLEALQESAIEKYYAAQKRRSFFTNGINIFAVCALLGGIYFLYSSPLKDLTVEYFSAIPAATGIPAFSNPAGTTVPQTDSVIRNVTTVNNQDISHILPLSEVFPELVGTLKCSGIAYGAVDQTCFINGHILSVGDTINGARILHIDPKVVILLRKRKVFSLTVV